MGQRGLSWRPLASSVQAGAGRGHVRRNAGQRRRGAAGLRRAEGLARPDSARRARLSPARGGAVVPPHRHHLCGLWRPRGAGAPDPVRRHPTHHLGQGMGDRAARPRAAHEGHQRVHQGRLWPPRHPQGQGRPRSPGLPESGFPPGDERPEGAARHLRPCRRHRHRAGRRRDLLCARGQCAHTVRRLLHAGEPRDHAAAVSGIVLALPHCAGRKLSRRTLGDVEIDRADVGAGRADHRAANARRLQFRLLRAFVSGRQARHRTGRRPRPHHQIRRRLYAHDRGLETRRRHLPPHRRRFSRSAGVPPRQRARRARPDVGLSGRQRHIGQCGRHRHRRRQGGLQLHAGDREILSRRRTDPQKRADLALPRSRTPRLCARQHRGAGGERGARLRRLRHADRTEGRQSHHRFVPRQAEIGSEEFHRPADAVAVDLPDLRRGRHCAAPRRPAALRAQRPRPHPHRAGRPHARRAQERLARGQFQPRRRHQGHLGVGWIRFGYWADRSMLSRTADNLYWLARYVERAEYLARILETTLRLTALPLAYVGESNEWESAVATAGCAKPFFAAYSEANEETVTEFLAFSTDNPSSIRNCIETARLNARGVRTALTIEMWDSINSAWLELRKWGNGPPSREEFARFLRWVMGSSLSFDGSAYRTMLRNDAYWFSRLGVYIERADNTARILDVKYHLLLPAQERVGGPLDYFQWASILLKVSAITSYHWVYRQNVKPWLVADLLMLRDEMPRSLASCYENIVQNLDRIAKAYGLQGPAQRHARAVRARLENSKIEEIFQNGLHEFIDDFVEDNNRLGSAVAQQYLL